MIPELGTFAIILALCFALIQGFTPIIHLVVTRGDGETDTLPDDKKPWGDYLTPAAIGQFIFIAFAMLCLIICFINNDMSVIFVREHSHTLLPLIYRIGAAWGGHEGSLLLWCLVLGFWSCAFMLFHYKRLSQPTFANIMMVLGWISTGFLLFLLLTSNPFLRDFPSDLVTGDDLVPLLQDPGLIFHPPMLYLGYVGFAIGFAFAVAALIEGKLTKEWVIALRPWIILPWAFLGCGIVLGSWWAYRELGWGGWWFWDPVENASLLPWLAATALIHSLIVSEKRDTFKGWTILLAIIAFSLSLLGTFLVRSGVLVSVHAFASDPTRGLFLLCYLTLLIGGALLLYSLRIKHFYQTPNFSLFSRETLLLINSVVMLAILITIVIGTIYPILLDALNIEKISVGEPYFNTVFLPMMLPLLLLMGLAPHVHWGEHALPTLWKKIAIPLLLSLLLSILGLKLLGFPLQFLAVIGVLAGLWVLLSTAQYAMHTWQLQGKLNSKNLSMIIAHMGLAIVVLGITMNKSYSDERQVKMSPGETVSLSGYAFTLNQLQDTQGSNYKSITAHFSVQNHRGKIYPLLAEQRIYLSHEQTLSKPGVLFNAVRDLYLALGTPFDDGSWSVRIYYKPCVRWIWAGGFLLLIGGLISLLTYFKRREPHYV